MAAWQRYNLRKTPVTPRAPDAKGLLPWVQRELHTWLLRGHRVINWLCDYIGYVAVDTTDEPGALDDKVLVEGSLTKRVVGEEGDRTLVLSVSPTIPGGGGGPATPGIPEDSDVPTTPEIAGMYLYPSLIKDPYLRAPARCLVAWAGGYGIPWAMFTRISGGPGTYVWRAPGTAPLYGYNTGGNLQLYPGDRIIIPREPPPGNYSPYSGIYEILDPGLAFTRPATFRRALDANTSSTLINGMVVQITDPSAVGYLNYWELTGATPDIDVDDAIITQASSYTDASVQELLSGSQLIERGATNEVQELTQTVPAGWTVELTNWMTPVGSPALTSLPAGMQTFQVDEASVDVADASNPFTLQVIVYKCDAAGVRVAAISPPAASPTPEWESQPLTTTPTRINWQYSLASAETVTEVQRFDLALVAVNSSASSTVVTVRWSTPGRNCWWRTTAQFNPAGYDHQSLYARDQDVGAAEAECHPACAIGDGRFHQNIGAATESSGDVTMPSDASEARLSLAGNYLYRIDSDGFLDGNRVLIHITNPTAGSPRWLYDGAANVGTMYGLRLAMRGGSNDLIGMKGSTTVEFWLDSTNSCWRLVSLPVTHYDPP